MLRFASLAIPLTLFACHHSHATTTVTAVAPRTPPPSPSSPPPTAPPVAQTTNLAVSDDLARACQLHLDDVSRAPKFAFDASSLLPEDRDLLEQVATCVTRGPLKGRHMRLTGRADPRGTEEYNLALGDRRATAVAAFLTRLGVPATQLAETTRGALDARGADDLAYRIDRRVDIELNN